MNILIHSHKEMKPWREISSDEQQEYKGKNPEGSGLVKSGIWWDTKLSWSQRPVLVTLTILNSLF